MRRGLAVGVALLTLGALAFVIPEIAVSAHDDGDFHDKNYAVSGDCVYDDVEDETTCSFTLTGDEAPSHVLVVPCVDQAPTSTSPSSTYGDDPSTGHKGSKFDPGVLGAYSLTYDGFIGFVDVVVKNGPGHKHFHVGAGSCDPPAPTTTTTTAATTTTTGVGATTTTTVVIEDTVVQDVVVEDTVVAGIVEEQPAPAPASAPAAQPRQTQPRFTG